MKNIFKVVFVIVGTLIGAGFASGKEIYLFFGKYGEIGKIGIILTGILTGIIIYKVLVITKTYEINNYNKLLERINWKHSKLNKYINLIVNGFLLISFYIMIAGFSAYIAQTYNVPIYISAIIFAFTCYIIFKKSIQGVIKANEILVPLLIILIAYLGIKNIPYSFIQNSMLEESSKGWLIGSILYASYNSILLIPVLTGLRNYLDSRKQIIKISIISSTIIIVLALFIYFLLLRGEFFVSELEMPLIEISLQFGIIFKYIYGFVIISSIFTSAISAGYSFLGNVSKTRKNYEIILLTMCITGIAVSNIGFSKLVEILYPLFGVLGLIQIWMLIKLKN